LPELKRIMYVDDEPDIRVIAQLALEKVGMFDVKICATGQEAIDSALEFAPDLVLLDVMMPGMNGPETLRRLRKIPGLSSIPAVFMTAKTQLEEIAELKKSGVIEVINKPFDVIKLSDELRRLWAGHACH